MNQLLIILNLVFMPIQPTTSNCYTGEFDTLWASSWMTSTSLLDCTLDFIATAPMTGAISIASYDMSQPDIIAALVGHAENGGTLNMVVETDYYDAGKYDDFIGLQNTTIISDDGRSYFQHNKFMIINDCVKSGSANYTHTGQAYNINHDFLSCDPEWLAAYQSEFDQMFSGCFGRACKEDMSVITSTGDKIIFSPVHDNEQELIDFVGSATSTIHIAIFYMTLDSLGQALIQKHNEGVDVIVVMDTNACRNQYSEYQPLIDAGIDIRCDVAGGKIHAKTIIVDRACSLQGSMNFSNAGVIQNEENAVITCNFPTDAAELADSIESIHSLMPEWLPPSAEALLLACNDGHDNDHDFAIDGSDPSCMESNYLQCHDGIDNDGNYFFDEIEFGCWLWYPPLSGVWQPELSSTLPQTFTATAPYSFTCQDNPYTPELCDGLLWVAHVSLCNGCDGWKMVNSAVFLVGVD